MYRLRILAGLAIAAAMTAAPHAGAQTAPQQQAIGALTVFSVAYAAWIYEGRCHELDAAKRAEFQHLIEADLLRLNEVFEPRIVGAATGSGQKNGAALECGGENQGLSTFGMEQAADAGTELRGLPAGYRITVTP